MGKPYLDYSKSVLTMELSSFCNLGCSFCSQFNNNLSAKSFLDFELFHRILEEIKENSIMFESINPFFRGEPLLHPEFSSMLDLLYDMSVQKPLCQYIVLHTNGLLLTEEKACSILRLCSQDRLVHPGNIVFSIDAASAETYRKVRGGDLEKLMQNLRIFLSMRKDLSQWGPNIIFQFIVMPENRHEMHDFYTLITELCSEYSHKQVKAAYSKNNKPLNVQGDLVYFRMCEAGPGEQEQLEKLYNKAVQELAQSIDLSEMSLSWE